MNLRIPVLALLLCSLSCCTEKIQHNQDAQIQAADTLIVLPKENVDSSFAIFIEHFSADSIFQVSRIRFPLAFWQYDLDKDTTIYFLQNDVARMDFRQQRSTGEIDQWQQTIVPGKDNSKATIEIRGIDNGIMVDYYFEKLEGKWMLISVYDLST